MEEPISSSQWPIFYECPACHQEVEAVAGEHAQLIHCPHCQEAFVVAAEDGSTDIPDESAADKDEKSREEELDGLRIRQVAKMRRGAIRSQSYCLVVVGACLVSAVKLVLMGVQSLRWHLRILIPISYFTMALVLLIVGWHFVRLAVAYYRESRRGGLAEPSVPPDFSSLSDGSQAAENLKNVK